MLRTRVLVGTDIPRVGTWAASPAIHPLLAT